MQNTTDYLASLIVAILCGVTGLLVLRFNKDAAERATLIRLFAAAFAVRLIFTFIMYQTGFINNLGGADDTVWMGMWEQSRYWETSGPTSFGAIYDPGTLQANAGWAYFGALFYYLLNMESQMALAFFNCFMNALTVVIIYKAAREFCTAQASTFIAWAAALMPGFLIWSALTIKETWLILFEITTFYAVWRMTRRPNSLGAVLYALLIFVLIVITLGFRFYVAAFLTGGVLITLMCCRAHRPVRSAGIGLIAVILVYGSLHSLGIVHFDLISTTEARLAEMSSFRANASDPNQPGTESGVQFDFDTTTTGGAFLMLLAGSAYLLLSPFPWEIRSLGSAAALPDVLLWWWLVFFFIVPGIGYAWRRRPAMVLSIGAFVLPLFMFYAFMFGNVGLAYRQRAQIMPFLLILAAAGYQKREEEKARRRSGVLQKGADEFTPRAPLVREQWDGASPGSTG